MKQRAQWPPGDDRVNFFLGASALAPGAANDTLPASIFSMPSPTDRIRSVSPAPDRGASRSTLGRRELAIGLLGATLAGILPWAYGGMVIWSQFVAAGLAATMLLFAWSGHGAWDRLKTFPIFWGGLATFAYVALQMLNPAYDYHREGADWWLEARTHLGWLPAGMRTPAAIANPARTLLLWFPAWAAACALWTALRHRRALGWTLTAVAINGAAFALFALMQKAAGTAAIYGVVRPASGNFVGAILYSNHAAAYFNLLTALCLALALHRWERDRHRPAGGGPAILYLLGAALCAAGTLLTVSFSGIIFLGIEVVFAAILVLPRWQQHGTGGRQTALLLGAGLCALLLLLGGRVVASRLEDHFSNKLADWGARSAESRLASYTRGVEMWQDRWLLGWGAGSFRYGFTKYSRDISELPDQPGRRFFWEHLHNDWLEWLIELGVLGFMPILLMSVWWLRRQFPWGFWRDSPRAMLGAGLLLPAAFACIDFPFQNPAVLITAATLLALHANWRAAAGEGGTAIPTVDQSRRVGTGR